MARASLCLTALLALAGCAAVPQAWIRPDGSTPTSGDLQLAMTACKGEVEKAAVQGGSVSTLDRPFGLDHQDYRVLIGCMAQRGYLVAGQR